MAGKRKRQHPSAEEQEASLAPQHTIKKFANVRKLSDLHSEQKKRKTVHQHDLTPVPEAAVSSSNDKKRKRGPESENAALNHKSETSTLMRTTNDQPIPKETEASTPRRKRVKNAPPPSPEGTPSKGAMAMLDKLKIGANIKPIPFAFNAIQKPVDTPPTSPEQEDDVTVVWPAELDDMCRLNAAFLSALSLYYAHNGTSSPVNVKALLPMITKHWKKRAVSLDDLRTLLALEQESEASFILQDFDRAGICLTKQQSRGRAIKRAASFVDEVELNSRFEDMLKKRWTSWFASTPKENRDVTVFLDQLPLSEITRSESVEKAAPLFARGHQRLADLKASQAASHAEELHPSKLTPTPIVTPSAQSRGSSLLDRILAKQVLTASLPAGPTKEQLERKAALHRIEDIARILDLLAAGRPRVSFSMQAMVQQLQQSLRNPISREEVERCLDIMANEVTPGFVNLVKSGSVSGVVITRGGRVGLQELREKVERAVG